MTGTGVDLNGAFTLSGNNLVLGDLTVDGSSSVNQGANTSAVTANLTVGKSTLSTWSITGGASLSSGPSVIGDQAGSAGSQVTVSGNGSLWQVNGGLTVGNASTGALSIDTSGAAVLDTLDLGAQSTGTGGVTVSGTGSGTSISA